MSLELLGLLLDILVLGFLGAMIYYSLRLSRSLSDFRAHRQEFDTMIIKLMSSIDQAERSIASLKQAGMKESEELTKLIRQSKALSEELQIINEAGENMARRLEELAEKNRKAAQAVDLSETPSERYKPYKPPKVSAPPPVREKIAPVDDFPSFITKDIQLPATTREEPESPKFKSQAERDLYEALRGKTNQGNKGR